MSRSRFFFASPGLSFILTLLLMSLLASPGYPQKKKEKFVVGEVLVKFRPKRTKSVQDQLAGRLNSSIVEQLGDQRWVRVRLSPGQSVEDAVKQFSKLADVEAVQPNYYYYLQTTPNDTMWGDPGLYGMLKISAPSAWDISTGSSNVVVADIDTGLDYTHEDLAANAWTNPGEIPGNGLDDDGNGFVDDVHGYDFRYNDPDPMDEHGHGTHTAGTIGAVGNNMLGVVGVCWHVKIMGIKIYSATADDTTSAMVINAYNYVRMMKERGVNIRVTNNSYGGCPETCGEDIAVKDGIDAMGDAGILNVFAAGNSSTNNDVDPFFPASYTSPSIISVGGSDADDNRIFNYGATTVDIAAPGFRITSTIPMVNTNHYGVLSGTSMSTPHVTGAAALLSALDPKLSAASIKATLINTADVLPQFTGFNRANGRLNVANALQHETICTFTLGANSMRVPTKGGQFVVDVTTGGQNCDFGAHSTLKWIRINGPDEFTSSGTVKLWVTVNPTITRSGVITIAGQPFTITQSRQ
jgi:subtilisin family serine protease